MFSLLCADVFFVSAECVCTEGCGLIFVPAAEVCVDIFLKTLLGPLAFPNGHRLGLTLERQFTGVQASQPGI